MRGIETPGFIKLDQSPSDKIFVDAYIVARQGNVACWPRRGTPNEDMIGILLSLNEHVSKGTAPVQRT